MSDTVTQILAPEGTIVEPTSKEEHRVNFVHSFEAVENDLKTLREHKKELMDSYAENNWLSKKEQKALIKALKMVKQSETLEELSEAFDTLTNMVETL